MIDFTPLLTWLAYAFSWIGTFLATYKGWVYTVAGTALITALSWALISPSCWFNNFLISLVDTIASVFPSTPSEFQIGSLLTAFYAQVPTVIGAALVSEVLQGLSGIFSIWIIWKIYKALPFT